MARTVVVGNETFKQRNVVGVWLGLPLITLGVYSLVWYFKVNNEARRYLRDDRVHPWSALLAVTFGSVLIIPPFFSVYQTCARIRRMEEQAGVQGRIEPILGLVLIFIFGLHVWYIQAHLNNLWGAYLLSAPATTALPVPPPGQLTAPAAAALPPPTAMSAETPDLPPASPLS